MAIVRATLVFLASMFLIWSANASDPPKKVTVSLYYESLCPFSANFITNYLKDIFTNGLISIVDLRLIPFGNAKILDDGSINCQHGVEECELNIVEACAINVWPDVNDHFKFINCVEEMVVDGTYREWKKCFDKFDDLESHQLVLDCSSGVHGRKLEYQYGAETNSLVPAITGVPSVFVDGKLANDAYAFETAVCEAYTGELPEACQEAKTTD